MYDESARSILFRQRPEREKQKYGMYFFSQSRRETMCCRNLNPPSSIRLFLGVLCTKMD